MVLSAKHIVGNCQNIHLKLVVKAINLLVRDKQLLLLYINIESFLEPDVCPLMARGVMVLGSVLVLSYVLE